MLIAQCSVDYSGRLSAHLPAARRLIIVKADGTVIVHCDLGSKPLNWMSPPCVIEVDDEGWTVLGAKGERLRIQMTEILSDVTVELGSEPGLRKAGSEDELQALLAAQPEVIEPGLKLIRREFPTDLGPVDLMCEDEAGLRVAVEVKRIGDIDGVEQLSRYLVRLGGNLRGIFVATSIKPQARVLAASRDIGCVEVNLDVLAGRREPDLTLF